MKFLNLDPYNFSVSAKERISKYFVYDEIDASNDFNLSLLEQYDVILVKFSIKFDKKVISSCKKLKYILCPATGVDHIDIDYCKSRGITIISLFNESEFLNNVHSSAEHTWALLMSTYKNVINSFDYTMEHQKWERNRFQTRDLFGKKIGIVGYGRNGRKIARYADAFGMEILVYDQLKINTKDENIQIQQVNLENLFAKSNIIILSISLNEQTRNLINKEILSNITTNCYLINTSRGEIVNEDSIINALSNGKLTYYATDVLTNEYQDNFLQYSKIFKYCKKNINVLITPHIAGSNLDSWEKTDNFVVEKLIKIVKSNE
jgi:D-3-phosphoglycerate dehydrogenase